MLQSVGSHLFGYDKILAIAQSWAIHLNHLVYDATKNDCGTLPPTQTTELL
ncbi:hypothetical protein THH46_00110 [Pseudomonas sp. NA13]